MSGENRGKATLEEASRVCSDMSQPKTMSATGGTDAPDHAATADPAGGGHGREGEEEGGVASRTRRSTRSEEHDIDIVAVEETESRPRSKKKGRAEKSTSEERWMKMEEAVSVLQSDVTPVLEIFDKFDVPGLLKKLIMMVDASGGETSNERLGERGERQPTTIAPPIAAVATTEKRTWAWKSFGSFGESIFDNDPCTMDC